MEALHRPRITTVRCLPAAAFAVQAAQGQWFHQASGSSAAMAAPVNQLPAQVLRCCERQQPLVAAAKAPTASATVVLAPQIGVAAASWDTSDPAQAVFGYQVLGKPQELQQQQQQRADQQALPYQQTLQQQPQQLQQTRLAKLQQRPVHLPGHAEALMQLLRECTSLLQLQAVIKMHMQQLPPSCLAAAMQQLLLLQRQQQIGVRQQQEVCFGSGNSIGRFSAFSISSRASISSNGMTAGDGEPLRQQLAAQLALALLQCLPQASAHALSAFLAAAAAARVRLPSSVLEQLAAHLVHRALRLACQQQQQQAVSINSSNGNSTSTKSSTSSIIGQTGGSSHNSSASISCCSSDSSICTICRGKANCAASVHNAFGDVVLPPAQQQSPYLASQATNSAAVPPAAVQMPHIIARAAWAFANLQLQQPAVWMELGSLIGEQVQQLSPQDCVVLCWALAHSGCYQPRVFHALQQQLKSGVWQLSPYSISCLVWSFARVGHYHHGVVSALLLAAASSMERFTPRGLTQILWASVKLRHYEPRMLSALRVRALASMHEMEPQGLALLPWALASFGVMDEPLMQAVSAAASPLMPSFSMQGLSLLAWSIAKMQQKHGQRPRQQQQQQGRNTGRQRQQQQFLDSICTAAAKRLPSAKPQELCNLLWACAVLRHKHAGLLAAASTALVGMAEDASPRDLAQATWALQVLGHKRSNVSQVLNLQALNTLHQFGPHALSTWAWAVASARMKVPIGLAAAVAQQYVVLLPQFTPQGLATTLWALGKLGHVPQQMLHIASSHILASMHSYNAQDLCNIAMVYCKAKYREPALLQGLAGAAARLAAATMLLLSQAPAAAAAQGNVTPASAQPVLTGSTAAPALAADVLAARLVPSVRPQRHSIGISQAVQAQHLTPQGVCNLVWAFAGSGWHDPLLMQQLGQLAVLHMAGGHLAPQHIAGLLQGFALLGEPCELLLAALVDSMQQGAAVGAAGVSSDKAGGVATYGCGSKHRGNRNGRQQQLLQPQPAGRLGRMCYQLSGWSADSLALLVWSAAASGSHREHGALLVAALQHLQAQGLTGLSQARCSQLHLSITLLASHWGIAHWGDTWRLDLCDKGKGSSRSKNSCADDSCKDSSSSSSSSNDRPASQQQMRLGPCWPAEVPTDRVRAVLCGQLAWQCAAAWQQQESANTLQRTEHEMVQTLQSMGLQPLTQHWILPLFVTSVQDATSIATSAAHKPIHTLRVQVGVDPVRLSPGRRPLAIELLPTVALSSSWPTKVLGQTAMKHQCLRAAGWEVVMLTADEWDSLQQDRGKQRHLLQELLRLSPEHDC